MKKKCEIYDRDCINCGECLFCELDPTKICDNCGKCINMDDYYSIKIDKIETNDDVSNYCCQHDNNDIKRSD